MIFFCESVLLTQGQGVHIFLNLMNTADPERRQMTDLECEVVELFVHLAGMLKLPRSVGEIYGLLYISPAPMAMDELMSRLDISKGSTSQGLKLLRGIGAVKATYVPGDRRDHYQAETELRDLVAGFIREQVQPELKMGVQRIEKIRACYEAMPNNQREKLLSGRVVKLEAWHSRISRALPMLLKLVEFRRG